MPVINEETRAAWQRIADECGKQRPYRGRKVRVDGGRKHKGKIGTVVRHQLDQFYDVFRYGGEASHHMAQMAGREGYVVMVQPDDGCQRFWVKAHYVTCIDAEAGETTDETVPDEA